MMSIFVVKAACDQISKNDAVPTLVASNADPPG
jgi:hypothetical protein